MTDYTKLVEALRGIEKTMFALGTSPINMDNVSIRLAYDKRLGPIAKDSADAIEALQAEVPKRGKWVREMNVYDEPFYHCSACGECFDSNRDDTYGIFNYCPNCGAKMEVQDGK